MLLRKLFRTARKYKAQFVSMIIMVTIGIGIFFGFNIEWYSLEKDTGEFFQKTNYADYRLYDDSLFGFSRKDIEKIREIDGVRAATRFLTANVSVADSDRQLAAMVSEDYSVSTMHLVSGAPYDVGLDGVWLSDQFAFQNHYAVGDTLTLSYMGKRMSFEILGLCKSGETMICVADKNQIMPDFSVFGFAFLSPAALKRAVGTAFYPEIHIISDLDKEALETAVASAVGKTLMVVAKADHISYKGAQSEIKEGQTMAAILPVLFLAIGVLTMVTTMHRIAANEKVQIGTLKALGFKDRRILAHYTAYGLTIGIIGSAAGILLGYGLAHVVLNPNGMMGTYFDLPEWKLCIPSLCVPTVLATIMFLTLISFLSVKKMLLGTAADVLRPYTPKAMKKLPLERFHFWEKLSFGAKWNLRDVLRHKSRSIMTLIGVIGCMMLLVSGLGMKDSLDGFLSLLNDTCAYTTKVTLSDNADNAAALSLAQTLGGGWSATSGVSYNGKTIALEIYDVPDDQIRFVDEDNRYVALSDDGAYLCLRLADTANIGDTIRFSPYGSDETYSVKVAGYLRSVTAENIVLTKACAENAGVPYRVDALYTAKAASEIPASSLISGKQDKSALLGTYDSFMEILNLMVWMLVLAAIILGIVVLYNLGVMSYLERSRELATLKVLGFRDRKIGALLVSQNAWLTIIGVLLGFPAGAGILYWLLKELGSDYELKLTLGALTYIVSILVTFGVSLAVGWMVAGKNKKINMVEALKVAE